MKGIISFIPGAYQIIVLVVALLTAIKKADEKEDKS